MTYLSRLSLPRRLAIRLGCWLFGHGLEPHPRWTNIRRCPRCHRQVDWTKVA